MLDHIPELPLSQAELHEIVQGVPAELDPNELHGAASDLDLSHVATVAGLDDAEALAVQIVWVRMYAAKLQQLQALFENKRH